MTIYTIGWVIPDELIGLTFSKTPTARDKKSLARAGTALVARVPQEFHVMVDYRKVALKQVPKLDEFMQTHAYLTSPYLRWIMLVLPEKYQGAMPPMQSQGRVQLMTARTIDDAALQLYSFDSTLHFYEGNRHFFPDAEITIDK